MSTDSTYPAHFFESVYQAFLRASENHPNSVYRSIEIAGFPIQFNFANSALIPYIMPALQHHVNKTSTTHQALTICLWDTTSTNVPIPARPWSQSDFIQRGEINGYHDDRIFIAYHIGPDILSMLDMNRNLAIFWTRDADKLSLSTEASPLRTIFHWWMRSKEIQLIHAACVGTADGSVIFVGRGGSGKSTTALTCMSKEMLYLGDDMVLVSSQPSPYAYNLYNSAKADAKTLMKLRKLSLNFSATPGTNNDKSIIFLQADGTKQIASSLPIRAIVIPKITGLPHTTIAAATPLEGLKAIAPSTVLMLSGADSKDLSVISEIVKQVPIYNLQLGSHLEEVPDIILNLLSG